MLSGVRVLVVDDDADVREFLRTVLASCGAVVRVVSSVRAAMMEFDRLAPEVVVSDIGMPEHDGFALISAIRRRSPERGGDVPVVALTGFTRAADRRRVLGSGFQLHVAKPVEADEILAIVASLARIVPPR
jgi:CheY-like chemotaxis protein